MTATITQYTPPATVGRFMQSPAFVRLIQGPVGSGKSVGCAMELVRWAAQIPANAQGIRQSRFAIARNTARMLRDTTIKTVHEWLPPGVAGKWHASSQTFFLRFGDVESEWMFRPLDSPEDAANLLSLELTGAWLNEFREINQDIFIALIGRVGRHPRRRSLPPDAEPRFGIVGDSNPPNVGSHWWSVMEQPPSPELVAACGLPAGSRLVDSFRQPGGRTGRAENVANLPPNYYARMVALNSERGEEWLKVHVDGEYGADQHHLPVYPEFRRGMHVAPDPLVPIPSRPLLLGFDYGRTPACVVVQCDALGRWLVLAEYFREGVGFDAFCEWLLPMLRQRFPDHRSYECFGDPAGRQKAQSSESTCVEVGRAYGFVIRSGPQDLETRVGSVRKCMVRLLPDGKPGLMFDPSCKLLITGAEGEYRYRRIRTTEDLTAVPDKNRASHTQDALQYVVGFYEGPVLRGGIRRSVAGVRPSPVVIHDWGRVYPARQL